MKCRHCGTELTTNFIDLGSSPPSNAYLAPAAIREVEKWYPLKVMVCDSCWLVQTEDFIGADSLFSDDYAYFSSYSSTWLEHARHYVTNMVNRFHLGTDSLVLEIAANDGYLLQYIQDKGIPCYGIEPTHSTAAEAKQKGITIIEEFFTTPLAEKLNSESRTADLIIANNVLAHVPDINDFTRGISILLRSEGIATFEFPHLVNLVKEKQFDTIYHEHYSYLSLIAVNNIFTTSGLVIFDVEELSTHGGSLRVYAQRADTGVNAVSENVHKLLNREMELGLTDITYYQGFQQEAEKIKYAFLDFLLDAKKNGHKVVAYGAAAKGNTVINYSGVKQDLIDYVIDKNPAKQGKYLPGSRIPIISEDSMRKDKPDYVLILPWNLGNEIKSQLDYIRDWGGKFVTLIPELKIQ